MSNSVIDGTEMNPMKCYLLPAAGNPLFWSALSALENPTTLTRPSKRFDINYNLAGKSKRNSKIISD